MYPDIERWLNEAQTELRYATSGVDLRNLRNQIVEALVACELALRKETGSVAPYASRVVRSRSESLEDEDFVTG